MVTNGQHAISGVGDDASETPRRVRSTLLNDRLDPQTKSIVTANNKLMVFIASEREEIAEDRIAAPLESVAYQFGVFVFDCRDLSLCSCVPMFRDKPVYISKLSNENWLIYNRPGIVGIFALPITNGHIGRERKIHCTDRCSEILVAGDHIYLYNPNERDGTIQFYEFDMLTGKKVRTLETFILWLSHEELNGNRIERVVANAHVVGNSHVVFLISSVFHRVNCIVTFALPPVQK